MCQLLRHIASSTSTCCHSDKPPCKQCWVLNLETPPNVRRQVMAGVSAHRQCCREQQCILAALSALPSLPPAGKQGWVEEHLGQQDHLMGRQALAVAAAVAHQRHQELQHRPQLLNGNGLARCVHGCSHSKAAVRVLRGSQGRRVRSCEQKDVQQLLQGVLAAPFQVLQAPAA